MIDEFAKDYLRTDLQEIHKSMIGTLHGLSEYDIRRPLTPTDRHISESMAIYWTNFAKRGDPNGNGLPPWPAFSDGHPQVQYFAGASYTGAVPSENSLRVLDSYFAWRRTPEGAVTKAPARKPGKAMKPR